MRILSDSAVLHTPTGHIVVSWLAVDREEARIRAELFGGSGDDGRPPQDRLRASRDDEPSP